MASRYRGDSAKVKGGFTTRAVQWPQWLCVDCAWRKEALHYTHAGRRLAPHLKALEYIMRVEQGLG